MTNTFKYATVIKKKIVFGNRKQTRPMSFNLAYFISIFKLNLIAFL